ncbi:MAG: hypothetical protein WD055_01660 [Candidatus Dependentiae bacterium]
MNKMYMLALLSLLGVSISTVKAEKKTAFYINRTGEDISVKGPYAKGERYVDSDRVKEDDFHPEKFEASNNEILNVKFLVGHRSDRKAIELSSKFPEDHSVLIITKEVTQDKNGKEETSYKVLKSDRFTEVKTMDAKSY